MSGHRELGDGGARGCGGKVEVLVVECVVLKVLLLVEWVYETR